MTSRLRSAFLGLMLAQAAHSVEEYVFRLYDVFAPARFVSGLVSDDLARGFAVANVLIVFAGLASYVAIVRPGRPLARSVSWFWSLLEFANGVIHCGLALVRFGYFPGVATAPALLALAGYLLRALGRGESPARG
jgi:uncharacterized protein with HXXEE motif